MLTSMTDCALEQTFLVASTTSCPPMNLWILLWLLIYDGNSTNDWMIDSLNEQQLSLISLQVYVSSFLTKHMTLRFIKFWSDVNSLILASETVSERDQLLNVVRN